MPWGMIGAAGHRGSRIACRRNARNDAAKDAAKEQAKAAREATALQREMYYQTRSDQEPFREQD